HEAAGQGPRPALPDARRDGRGAEGVAGRRGPVSRAGERWPAFRRNCCPWRRGVKWLVNRGYPSPARGEGSNMTQIVLDATLASKLHDLTQAVELCDPSGRVLGQFIPAVDMSEWEPITPDVSEEELDRRERSNEKRYTTAEVIAYLEKL